MFKPVELKVLEDYRLWVKYEDGVEGEIDLSQLVGRGVFSLWDDYAAFEKAYIGQYGEIAWSEDIDICPDRVYLQITGKSAAEIFPRLDMELTSA